MKSPTDTRRGFASTRIAKAAAAAAAAFLALAAVDVSPAADELAALGDRYRLAGDHEKALQFYELALAREPAEPAAWAGLAASLEALDEKATLDFLSTTSAEPALSLPAETRAVLADGWARRRIFDKAVAELDGPPPAGGGRAAFTRAKMALARGDLPAAIKGFNEARAAGEEAAAYFLGEALLAAGRADEAELYLNEFLTDFPYVAAAHVARGEALFRRGDYEAAAAAFNRALAFDAGDERALAGLATLAVMEGDYGRAIRLDADILSLDPWDRTAWLNMVGAYEHVDPTVAAAKLREYERRFGG